MLFDQPLFVLISCEDLYNSLWSVSTINPLLEWFLLRQGNITHTILLPLTILSLSCFIFNHFQCINSSVDQYNAIVEKGSPLIESRWYLKVLNTILKIENSSVIFGSTMKIRQYTKVWKKAPKFCNYKQ